MFTRGQEVVEISNMQEAPSELTTHLISDCDCTPDEEPIYIPAKGSVLLFVRAVCSPGVELHRESGWPGFEAPNLFDVTGLEVVRWC